MPVIKLTKADILRSQNLENECWYSWKITSFTGPVPSKDKQSLNYVCTFSLIDHSKDLDGKEIKRTYNSKAIAMIIPLFAAIQKLNIDQIPKEDFELDTDVFIGKSVDGKYTLETFEGQLVGHVDTYLPYKSAAGQAPPY